MYFDAIFLATVPVSSHRVIIIVAPSLAVALNTNPISIAFVAVLFDWGLTKNKYLVDTTHEIDLFTYVCAINGERAVSVPLPNHYF